MFFAEVKIGQNFFDPNSGEYFEKIGDNTAKFISGGDYFEGTVETFDEVDFVSLPWPESGY